MSNNGKHPTNRDLAKQAALHSYNAMMQTCISIITALEPYQDQLVQSLAGGQTAVSDWVYLQQLAREILANTQQNLARGGFMRAPAPPADAPPSKPRLVTDQTESS